MKLYNDKVMMTQLFASKLPNGESQNFENLRDYLDPYRMHLVSTYNAIVNEAYYYFDGKNLCLNQESSIIDNKFKEIPLNKRSSDKKQVHHDLIMCRENKRNHLNSLQKLSSFYNYHKSKLDGL